MASTNVNNVLKSVPIYNLLLAYPYMNLAATNLRETRGIHFTAQFGALQKTLIQIEIDLNRFACGTVF